MLQVNAQELGDQESLSCGSVSVMGQVVTRDRKAMVSLKVRVGLEIHLQLKNRMVVHVLHWGSSMSSSDMHNFASCQLPLF